MKSKKKKKSVGQHGDYVNDSLGYIREHAPSLVPMAATFLPFWDVVTGVTAGPQAGCKVHGPDDEPFFSLEIQDPTCRSNGGDYDEIVLRVTATRMVFERWFWEKDGDGEPEATICEVDTSLIGAWEYLRQLPRPVETFGWSKK